MKYKYSLSFRLGAGMVITFIALLSFCTSVNGANCYEIGFRESAGGYIWESQYKYGTNKKYITHGDRGTCVTGVTDFNTVTDDIVLEYMKGRMFGGKPHSLEYWYRLDGGAWHSWFYNKDQQECGDDFTVHANAIDVKLIEFDEQTPGNHTLEYYFKATGIGKTEVNNYCNLGGSNMKLKYTTPGFSSSSVDGTLNMGDVNQGTTSTKQFSDKVTHYGNISVTCTRQSGDANFSVSFTNPGTIKVTYNASNLSTTTGTKTATFLLKDAYNKKNCTINVQADVVPALPSALRSEDPEVSYGPQVKLHGYLERTGCKVIDKMGFVFAPSGTTANITSTTSYSSPTITGDTVQFIGDFEQGQSISSIITKYNSSYLSAGTTYNYKVFARSTTADASSNYWFLSDQGTFTIPNPCTCSFDIADTVYYTIDNTKELSLCDLRFPTLEEAVADMKQTTTGHAQWMNPSTKMLTKNIVFEVASGTYGNSDKSTWDTSLSEINNAGATGGTASATEPGYRLIVRAKDFSNPPLFEGGLSLVNSRKVTLNGLKITRSTSGSGHEESAIELGYYQSKDYDNRDAAAGFIKYSDIQILNCKIEATAFTCVHATGCDGIVMQNNDFTLSIATSDDPDNDRNYGASIKLFACKNVNFQRNSMMGSHATTLWIEHTQNMLVLNNVFWNNNIYGSNVAFLRPVMEDDYSSGDDADRKITDLGIYYNTFYLNQGTDENPDETPRTRSNEYVDFIRFGGQDVTKTTTNNYDVSNMYCMYNNFYSYDTQIHQRNSDANAFRTSDHTLPSDNFTDNNFWSIYDAGSDSSPFKFGSNAQHVNVKEQVCQSTASKPGSLVIRGSGLNLGSVPPENLSSAILNEAHLTLSDRFNDVVRPEAGSGWTYGAFQQATSEEPINTIVWVGGDNGNWDLRSNWHTLEGKEITCVHSFTDDLKVIIPDGAKGNMPKIPAWGSHSAVEVTNPVRGNYPREYVEAGLGSTKDYNTTSKFFDQIEIQNGGSISGVENLGALGSASDRYSDASLKLIVPRSKWVLIGTVIKPWDSDGPQYLRGIDLYLDGVPQVYLSKITSGEDALAWKKTYESQWTEVGAQEAAAIRIPDQYGPKRLTAEEYYGDKSIATKPIEYTFWGRFANESSLPSYTLTGNAFNPVSNTYPANINVAKLATESASLPATGIYVYDIKTCSFNSSNLLSSVTQIKSQQGFVLKPTANLSLTLTSDVFEGGTTAVEYERGATVELPYIILEANNLTDNQGSAIMVSHDELKSEGYSAYTDADKLFNDMESGLPEMYILEYGRKLQTITVSQLNDMIPLGLRLKKNMIVSFVLRSTSGLDMALLVDNQTGREYDLLEGAKYNFELAKGTYEGRFFLKLGASDKQDVDVPTFTDEIETEGQIFIFSTPDGIVISSSKVDLRRAYFTDMTGRMTEVTLEDEHYNVLKPYGASGIYILTVIGDNASKTEKIVIK